MKRPSQTKTGASKPKKSVGDDPRRDQEIPYDKGKDQEMPSSPSSVDSLSFGSDTEFMADMYTIVDAEVRENGSLVLESLLHPSGNHSGCHGDAGRGSNQYFRFLSHIH
jgi:hypothetical protein